MSSLDHAKKAQDIATTAHNGQEDKIGVDYIEHPRAVAKFLQALKGFEALGEQSRSDAVAAAWLHDAVEDTCVTAEMLEDAGISEQAVQVVVALTRTDEVAPDDYYINIKKSPLARLVKTADIAHNLAPERLAKLDESTRTKLATKYSHALEVLGVDRSVITDLHTRFGRSDGANSPAELRKE